MGQQAREEGVSFARIHFSAKRYRWEWNQRSLHSNVFFSVTSFPTKEDVKLKACICNNQSEKQRESKPMEVVPSAGKVLIFRFFLCSRWQIASTRYREKNFF